MLKKSAKLVALSKLAEYHNIRQAIPLALLLE